MKIRNQDLAVTLLIQSDKVNQRPWWLRNRKNMNHHSIKDLNCVIHYLSNHEAHEAEDPHRDMSRRPHEEVDDVGVKRGV